MVTTGYRFKYALGMKAVDKARENRLRRACELCELRLERSPRRDPQAVGFRLYRIEPHGPRRPGDPQWPFPGRFWMTLDEVEAWLAGGSRASP